MKNLDFGVKKQPRTNYKADVAVRINKNGLLANGEYRYCVAFRFYNDSAKKIVNKEEHVAFAIDSEDNRIYFKESNSFEGYKLSRNKTTQNSLTITRTIYDMDPWEKIVGDYVLLYDRTEKLHYIDLNKNLKK